MRLVKWTLLKSAVIASAGKKTVGILIYSAVLVSFVDIALVGGQFV